MANVPLYSIQQIQQIVTKSLSNKSEPLPRILGEYLYGCGSADTPVLHFRYNIL